MVISRLFCDLRHIILHSRLKGLDGEADFFVGRHEDVLRQVDGAWKVVRRSIIFDGRVLNAQNLNIFF